MPVPQPTTDRAEIRRRLNQDRDWSLYALADLEDGMFEHCRWWTCGDEGLALDFPPLHIRPLFLMGDAATTRALLSAMDAPSGYLNLRHEQVEASEGIYAYRDQHEMNRMMLGDLRRRAGETVTLTVDHVEEIEALYRTTPGAGFVFAPSQLNDGFFRGVRRDGELVAIAGVHVVSQAESAAGLGNVYTRPDHRGRGLAQVVTSAVAEALRDAGICSIGLNVEATNTAAVSAYQRIGFETRFSYVEGPADRVG